MKKILVVSLLIIFNSFFAQSAFSNGYSDGHKKGYCNASSQNGEMTCNYPFISVTAPLPKIGENSESYKNGYDRGLYDEQLAYTKKESNEFPRKPYQYRDPGKVELFGGLTNLLQAMPQRSYLNELGQWERIVIEYNINWANNILNENNSISNSNLNNLKINDGLLLGYLLLSVVTSEYKTGTEYYDILPVIVEFSNSRIINIRKSDFENSTFASDFLKSSLRPTDNKSVFFGTRTLPNGYNQKLYLYLNDYFKKGVQDLSYSEKNFRKNPAILLYSKNKRIVGKTLEVNELNYNLQQRGDVHNISVVYSKNGDDVSCNSYNSIIVSSSFVGINKVQNFGGSYISINTAYDKQTPFFNVVQLEDGKCTKISVGN